MSTLNEKVDELMEANKRMLLVLAEVSNIIKQKNENEDVYSCINGIQNTNKTIAKTVGKILNIVQPKEAVIQMSHRMKKTGKGHPQYKDNIPTEEVVNDYISNGYKITTEMLDKYPSITYNGLRDRLMKAHVWRARGEKKSI